MRRFVLVIFGMACFVSGAFIGPLIAQAGKPTFNVVEIKGKTSEEAAAALLGGALQLTDGGSWERIAVGRAWYLGGSKEKGQEILDIVTTSKKVESSDWLRVGRVYAEAGEWEKSSKAFERALAMKPGDDSGTIEYGAWANLNHDRAKAEALFDKAMKREPRDFWHWVTAGGSYLGVRPE